MKSKGNNTVDASILKELEILDNKIFKTMEKKIKE